MGTGGAIVLALMVWVGSLWIIEQIEKWYGKKRKK